MRECNACKNIVKLEMVPHTNAVLKAPPSLIMLELPDRPSGRVRYTLRAGATVFGLSAAGLIAFPAFFLELLGLEPELPLMWSMVMIGITLVALTGNMAVVSVSAGDGGVRMASVVMLFAAAGLGMITLLIPVAYTWFTLAYAAVGFGFSLAYLVGLLRARHSG